MQRQIRKNLAPMIGEMEKLYLVTVNTVQVISANKHGKDGMNMIYTLWEAVGKTKVQRAQN